MAEPQQQQQQPFDLEAAAPNLDHIVHSQTLKWVFVGGKGGVGKTTVSCCLALRVAAARPDKRVLLISTDPAHNTSDAFAQRFGRAPSPVAGMANLDVMEIDASSEVASMSSGLREAAQAAQDGAGGLLGSLLPDIGDIAGSLPGVDEAMSFAEVLRQVRSMHYDVVLFDTAPTGHTLRFLQFPGTVRKGLSKIIALKSRFGGLISGALRSFGGAMGDEVDEAAMDRRLQETLSTVEEITTQFKNPSVTTFVPVMIPEFLSLYETERLVQELARGEMDVSAIVINQVVTPDAGPNGACCRFCTARSRMQTKYIEQARDLYEDFHLIVLPMLDHEIRGVEELLEFGGNLVSAPSAPAAQQQ
eukprot:m51a1_g12479 putative atpase get3 (360) ;mRNA; r:2568-3880